MISCHVFFHSDNYYDYYYNIDYNYSYNCNYNDYSRQLLFATHLYYNNCRVFSETLVYAHRGNNALFSEACHPDFYR